MSAPGPDVCTCGSFSLLSARYGHPHLEWCSLYKAVEVAAPGPDDPWATFHNLTCERRAGLRIEVRRKHVCGLTGFGAIGDYCPGCQEPPFVRDATCTCGLDAARAADTSNRVHHSNMEYLRGVKDGREWAVAPAKELKE